MHSLRKVGAVALVGLAPSFVHADSTWVGALRDLNADWSSAANWDGGVPTGSSVATIGYGGGNSGNFHVLGLTPPTDFTGTINVTYDTSTDWDVCFHNTLKLTVPDGATWTVSGNGMLYASEPLSSRIASDFTGTIVITNGASFTALTSLSNAVEFVGDGRLVISETKRLTHISGFTGTLVWAGDATLSPSDTTALQLRSLELANGASLDYAEKTLSANAAIKIEDWNEAPSDWTFGGVSGTHDVLEFDERLAHPNDDGSLALVTDPKQIHSAVYTGRRLKVHDSWGVSFRFEPALPEDSSVSRAGWRSEMSGTFGFYMTTNVTCAGGNYGMPMAKSPHGFQMFFYDSITEGGTVTKNNRYVGWFRGAEVPAAHRVKQKLLNQIDGPDLYKPMDVTMANQDGLLTVVLKQDGRYFAFTRNASTKYLHRDVPDGYYLAFCGNSDWWKSSETAHLVPWSQQTIRSFRGWYRAREAGRWVADSRSFYPFTAENCTATHWTNANTCIAKTEDALEADGSFKVEVYKERLETIIRMSNALDRRKRHLVSYDLVYGTGTGAENTERFKFGFTRATDVIGSWVYRWDDKGHNDIANERWNNYVYPFFVTLYLFSGKAYFFTTQPASAAAATVFTSANFDYPKMLKNQTAHTSLVYDGGRTLYYQVQTMQHVTDVSWAPSDTSVDYSKAGWGNENNMFFLMSSQNTWGQVDTWLKNFSVKTLNDNQEVYLSGGLSVAAGATANFQANALKADSAYPAATLGGVSLAAGSTLQVTGSKAAVEGVRVTGSGATLSASAATTLGGDIVYEGDVPAQGLTLAGSVTLTDGAVKFTVPDAWKTYKGYVTLLSAPAAALPTSVRIVTDSGRDLTARATVTVADGKVTAVLGRGLSIMIR